MAVELRGLHHSTSQLQCAVFPTWLLSGYVLTFQCSGSCLCVAPDSSQQLFARHSPAIFSDGVSSIHCVVLAWILEELAVLMAFHTLKSELSDNLGTPVRSPGL